MKLGVTEFSPSMSQISHILMVPKSLGELQPMSAVDDIKELKVLLDASPAAAA